MPRTARIKSFDLIYHVICRGISEVELFKEDKDKDKDKEHCPNLSVKLVKKNEYREIVEEFIGGAA